MGLGKFIKYWPLMLVFTLGAIIGFGFANTQANLSMQKLMSAFYPLRDDDESFSFVHPLLLYESPEATVLPEYAALKRKVEDLVNENLHSGNAESISVYYRNVRSGRWIGINENTAYYPASLLKVPLMIAYFKAEESDPTLFSQQITFQPISTHTNFEASSGLVVGRSYTVKELVEQMIINSDNGATFTLFERIDPMLLARVYEQLGIAEPGDDSSTYTIPTKTYALFFRTLYNGTYLTPEASEKALEMLSRSSYHEGLVAGVSHGTVVAHKFGEHVVVENEAPVGEELHDCGIIYKTGRHYLLCVMTKAKTLEAATSVIRSISSLVYENETGD